MTHMFDMRCRENGVEHRLTKIKHPWTNGQVERMNRTIKEATVKRYHYDRHEQLENHLADFINAYNYARRLKTLKGLTPYEYICKLSTKEPERFKFDPIHQMPGLNAPRAFSSELGAGLLEDNAIKQRPRELFRFYGIEKCSRLSVAPRRGHRDIVGDFGDGAARRLAAHLDKFVGAMEVKKADLAEPRVDDHVGRIARQA